jgi:hypothetical protein
MQPDRRLFAPGWPMLADGGGAQIIYSVAVGRQPTRTPVRYCTLRCLLDRSDRGINLSATLTSVGFARPMTSQSAAGLLCAVGGRIRQVRIDRRLPAIGGGTSGDSPLR